MSTFRQLFLAAARHAASVCTALILLGGANRAHAQAPLHSTVFPADSARSRHSSPTNSQRSIVDTVTSNLSKLEMHETTLPPGGSPHPPHRHGHEELMVVQTGTLEVLQGTATRMAAPGSVIFMASNELHGLRNPGPGPATYLVIRIDPHDVPADFKTSSAARAATPSSP